MKRHLKRISIPKTWKLARKTSTFVTRPNPGSHRQELGMSLNTCIKEILGMAKTSKEVKAILNSHQVIVNGKRRKDPKFMIGFMDVLSLPEINKHYLVSLNNKGWLAVIEKTSKDITTRAVKLVNKTQHRGGFQLNCMDGTNVLVKEHKCTVGDTMLLSVSDNKITDTLSLKKGSKCIIYSGKNRGMQITVKDLDAKNILFEKDGKTRKTTRQNIFVIP